MKRLQRLIWGMTTFLGILFILSNAQIAEAKKYYSLRDVGLKGCTTDNLDYGILSIRGNTVKYVKYELANNGYEWRKVGNVQSAKLTSATKYYVGDSGKVSGSLKKQGTENKNYKSSKNSIKNTKRMHMGKKDINSVKWIYRVRKATIKKYISSRNNEIRIVKGKVTKIAVRLSY